jgi:hypothetical protein
VVYRRFFNSLLFDYKMVCNSYADISDRIEHSLYPEGQSDPLIIEQILKDSRKFPIFREIRSFFETYEPSTLRYVLSFLNFGKKIHYADKALDQSSLRDWLDVEERLTRLVLPAWVENVALILQHFFLEWDADVLLPKHGSGAVAERGIRSIADKHAVFTISPRLQEIFGLQDSFGASTPDGALHHKDSEECARLKFVAKDMKKTRSICMEPVNLQYAQQGVRLWLESHLKDTWLRNHVVLEDQGVNRKCCILGSKDHSYDTIDLSSASDSVAWSLIQAIFPERILTLFNATRSTAVELPDGSIFHPSKYAPMGSSLCFPVQSILYSAVITLISICHSYDLDWSEPGVLDGYDLERMLIYTFGRDLYRRAPLGLRPFKAYGDDLIVDHAITSNVIGALRELGFDVNTGKSFTGSKDFRESCGMRAFRGIDVSPMTFKFKTLPSEGMTVDHLTACIKYANEAYDFGYWTLRRHLVQRALYERILGLDSAASPNKVLFGDTFDDPLTIYHMNPRNTHLSYRRNKDLQVGEYKRIIARPLKGAVIPEKFDNYRHLQWWRARYTKDPLEWTPSTVEPVARGVKLGWTPV